MGVDITAFVETRDIRDGSWHILPVKVECVRYVASNPKEPWNHDKAEMYYDYAQPWYVVTLSCSASLKVVITIVS